MALERVDILCSCDSCGKRFGVEVERATEIESFKDFEALAIAIIASGEPGYRLGIRGKETIDRFPLEYWVTHQGGMFLCDICSKKADDKIPVGTEATPELVREVLGLDVTP